MVLVVVLLVIAILGLAAGTFCELMISEREAAGLAARQAQARGLAESGIEMTRLFLSQDEQAQLDLGGWYNNPPRFQAVLVLDDASARQRGRFGLVAPLLEDGYFSGIRFGLENDSARLNLNLLAQASAADEESGRQVLMGLPGMTEEIADAILDWIDADEEPREFGAENEYYQMLDPPYSCRNGLLASIEELLLVRGVTPALLFGVDANRNGYAESTEPDRQSFIDVDNSDGSLDRGWSAYLTLYSVERNVRPDGTPKIDVNQEDLEALRDELVEALGEEAAEFIVAYRQYGPSQSSGASQNSGAPQNSGASRGGISQGSSRQAAPSSTGGSQGPGVTGQTSGAGSSQAAGGARGTSGTDSSRTGGTRLTSLLDLVGAEVEVEEEGQDDPTVLESPYSAVPGMAGEALNELFDHVTAQPSELIPGRVNINQASRVVLQGIPGMTQEMVDQILGMRQPDPVGADPQRRHAVWLFSQAVATLDEMKSLAPYVTCGGNVYRAQAIGYFDAGGPAVRVEVILDATTSPARVVSWKDISHLGPGYPTEILGVEVLR
jgi:DNA uptake protein ComE-like DNA-binding protein